MRITRRQTPQTIDPATLKPGATFYHAHVWAGDQRARITRYHVLAIGKRIKYAADGISSFTLSQSGALVTNYDATPAGALATLRARLAAEAAAVTAEIAIIDATTPTEPEPARIKIHSSEKGDDPAPGLAVTVISADGIESGTLAGNTITVTDRMRRYLIESKDGGLITYADSAAAAEKIAAAWRRQGYPATVVPPALSQPVKGAR